MNEDEFERLWSDRAARYPGFSLGPTNETVHIDVNPAYAKTYAGQVAVITAASLIGRMRRSVAVDVPSLPTVDPLPWAGMALDELVMGVLQDAHKHGQYEQRAARHEDTRLVIGSDGDGLAIHGSGWGAYHGTEPSPLTESDEPNPYGATFAVVMAAARLQRDPRITAVEPTLVDTYSWRMELPSPDAPQVVPDFELGELWSVGVGSVGSCALFFLGLVTRAFNAVLVDRDTVEVENVTRSALFSWRDALKEAPKVEVAGRWLHEIGVPRVEQHIAWLDEMSGRWGARQAGTPDILISAANERQVRSAIEASYPPLQVYGTTGRNWQATLFRHIPLRDGCSRCVPGGQTPRLNALCGTGAPEPPGGDDHGDDVSLPFLSYAAGLMTAAEITKLALTGRTDAPNRIFFEPAGRGLFGFSLRQRPGCICQGRDPSTHRDVIEGSRFASLSTE